MIDYLTSLPLVEQSLLAVLLGVFLYQVYFCLRYYSVSRKRVRANTDKIADDISNASYPGVSVIVAARNEAHNLKPYLYRLLEQDYPEYEVIVINDGSEDNTQDVIDDYAVRYKRLRHTFVPCQARVISTKKLALTLGVKAAKYEHLVFTDADCCPQSNQWLKAIMSGYGNGDAEIVLGMGVYFKDKSFLNRLIQYETLTSSLQYLGMAIAHKAYMGVGRNMSYLKRLFVNNNGFGHFASERAGDDDLFVNMVANRKNVAVVMTNNSLTWSVAKKNWKDWYQQRKRHLSVSHLYRFGSKLMLLCEPLSRGIFYAAVIALAVYGMPMVKCAAITFLLLRWLMLFTVLNISAHRIGVSKVGLDLMLWDIVYPLITLWIISTSGKNNIGWK